MKISDGILRLRRGTVEILAQMIGNCPEIPSPNQRPGRPPIPVHVQVLVTLWYLGHNDPYYEIAERFSIAASAAFNSVKRVCSTLVSNYMNELIEWPTGQKLIDTIDAFERIKGFPGVVGAHIYQLKHQKKIRMTTLTASFYTPFSSRQFVMQICYALTLFVVSLQKST